MKQKFYVASCVFTEESRVQPKNSKLHCRKISVAYNSVLRGKLQG